MASELPAIFQLASALIKAGGFLPTHLKVEGEIVAVVLAGRELGLAPMASIRGIKLVKGNVTLDAALQLALMIRAGCKVTWLDEGNDGQQAALQLERNGQKPYVSRFTLKDADRAGLVKDGSNWKMYPAAMLRARCISAAGKAYCPDILAGVYLPEEMAVLEAAEVPQTRPTEHRETHISTSPSAPTTTTSGSTEPTAPTTTGTPETTRQEVLKYLLEQRLPTATKLDDFVGIARELLDLHGPVRNSRGWKMFTQACASREVPPQEAIAIATDVLQAQKQEAAQ